MDTGMDEQGRMSARAMVKLYDLSSPLSNVLALLERHAGAMAAQARHQPKYFQRPAVFSRNVDSSSLARRDGDACLDWIEHHRAIRLIGIVQGGLACEGHCISARR